jgi:hypothetical protein
MTWFFLGIAVGIVIKVLVPWPWADDKIRAAWRWASSKVT